MKACVRGVVALFVSCLAYGDALVFGTAAVGDSEVTLPVLLECGGSSRVSALDFRLRYDEALLAPVSVSQGPVAAFGNKQVHASMSKAGEYVVVVMGMNANVMDSGEVARIHMSRTDEAATESTVLRITRTTLSTPEGVAVASQGSTLTLTFGEPDEPSEEEPEEENGEAETEDATPDVPDGSSDDVSGQDDGTDYSPLSDFEELVAASEDSASSAERGGPSGSRVASLVPGRDSVFEGSDRGRGTADLPESMARLNTLMQQAKRARAGIGARGVDAPADGIDNGAESAEGEPLASDGAAGDTEGALPVGDAPSAAALATPQATTSFATVRPIPDAPSGEAVESREGAAADTSPDAPSRMSVFPIALGVIAVAGCVLFLLQRRAG